MKKTNLRFSELDLYKWVNGCHTYEQLADVIMKAADKNGMIQGRTQKFNAAKMANYCRNFDALYASAQINLLTRNFGIRQQALMIQYYK